MNFGFDFTQSNLSLFRPGQFMDFTSPSKNTTYAPQYANNMAFGGTSAYGRDNLALENQRAQLFQTQTSSNEQKTQKSEKKKKRKKNFALRRAIEKKYIQKRQRELEVERCQVLLAAINQEQNSTKNHNITDYKPNSGNVNNLSDIVAKEALGIDRKQSEFGQPQMTQGASAKDNKKINIVSTTVANQDINNSKELRVMSRKKAKIVPNLSKKRRRGKDLYEITTMMLNTAQRNGQILPMDKGNSANSWNMADNQTLDKLNQKDDVLNTQFSGIGSKLTSVSEERQKEQYSVEILDHQELIQAKGIELSQTNSKKKQKKAVKPNSSSTSCLSNTLANEEKNLNLLKNIPVIDLSSPVPVRNVLSMTGDMNNIYPKKKRPAKSKKKQVCQTTPIYGTIPKPEERSLSKRAIKKQVRRMKRHEREAANQVASKNVNNHAENGPDKIDIPDQLRDGNDKMNQEEQEVQEKCEVQQQKVEKEKQVGQEQPEEQGKHKAQGQHTEQERLEPSLKDIPGYLQSYKTDTEKEVLGLMRELLGMSDELQIQAR